MSLSTTPPFAEPYQTEGTLAELLTRLGDIPLWRIRLSPPPGTATEEDMLAATERDDHHCELIDGVLVEKAMGFKESQLALMLGFLLQKYLETNPIGALLGEQGPFRTIKSRVRMPDLAFLLWSHYAPGDDPPAISEVTPDLAVEVISAGNTKAEMNIKLKEYFDAGTRHVWYIYPKTKTADLYTSPKNVFHIGIDGFLAAEDLLPGFQLRLGELFERVTPPTK